MMGSTAHQLSSIYDPSAKKSVVDAGLYLFLIAILAILVSQFYMEDAFADSNGAAIAYRSNTGTDTLDSVKYREWNPSSLSWGSEVELPVDPATSNVRFAWIEFSPISSKRAIVSLQSDGTIDSFVCSSGCTTATNWMIERDLADLWSTAPTGAQRPFDIEFEKTSGDLILVYDKVSTSSTQELFYRIMPAGEAYFGTEGAIDDTTSSLTSDIVYSFIRIDSQKTSGSDVVGMIALDETDSDAIAWRWDGSAWGDLHELTASAAIGTEEDIGVAFEASSGDMIIVAGEGTSVRYNEFSGGSWGSSATFATWAIGTINWVTLKADPVSTSDAVFVAATGSSSDMDSAYWSGSAWTNHAEHDAAIDSHAARVVDFAWDNTGSQGILLWGTKGGQLDFKRFSGTNTFSAQSSFAETSTHPWVQLADIANPTGGDTVSALGGTLDATFDIGGIRWDGAASNPVSTGDGGITADTTVTTYENFKVAWQSSSAAPSWVKTSGEGLGLSDGHAKDPEKQLVENVGLSDSLESFRQLLQQLNESLSLTDSRTISASRRLDENIGLSDSEAFLTSKSVPESVSLADAMSGAVTFSHSLAENLAAADQITKSMSKSMPENLAMADQSFFAATKYLSENSALSEQMATAASFTKSLSENLAATEISFAGIGKSMSENLAIVDQLTKDLSRSLLENIEIDIVLTTSIAYLHSMVENVALADLLSEVTSFTMQISENVGVGENLVRGLTKSLSENLELEDIVTTFTNFDVAIGENLSFTDMNSVATSFLKVLSESLVIAELPSSTMNFGQVLPENLALSDSIFSVTLFLKSLSENLAAGGIVTTGLDKLLSESLATAEELRKDASRSFTEGIEINDLMTTSTQFVQTIGENLAIAEMSSTLANFSKSLSESLEAVDEIASNFSKSIAEGVGTSELMTTSTQFVYSVAENLGFSDFSSSVRDFSVLLAEQLALAEVQSSVLTFSQLLSESLSFDVDVSSASNIAVSLAENLAFADTMTSFFDNLVLALGESIAIADSVSDIYIDIFFELIESLLLATSLFTPEVAYQNSLMSEELSLADNVELELEIQRNVLLNETINFAESATPVKHGVPTDGEEKDDDLDTRDSNRRHAQQDRETTENLALSDQVTTAASFNSSLAENLSVGGSAGLGRNLDPSEVLSEKLLDVNVSAKLDYFSTAYHLVPPAAVGSV
ncbi:MAG: hypothetical protein MN733_14860, partial [Nitrososphaera sp.]|nr:hypothetical protein [Nitrososphaera sp.]